MSTPSIFVFILAFTVSSCAESQNINVLLVDTASCDSSFVLNSQLGGKHVIGYFDDGTITEVSYDSTDRVLSEVLIVEDLSLKISRDFQSGLIDRVEISNSSLHHGLEFGELSFSIFEGKVQSYKFFDTADSTDTFYKRGYCGDLVLNSKYSYANQEPCPVGVVSRKNSNGGIYLQGYIDEESGTGSITTYDSSGRVKYVTLYSDFKEVENQIFEYEFDGAIKSHSIMKK